MLSKSQERGMKTEEITLASSGENEKVHVGKVKDSSVEKSNHIKPCFPDAFPPSMLNPPLNVVEFTSFSKSLEDSMGDSLNTNSSTSASPDHYPEAHFRLMPRKPHLLDRSPTRSARGRKRSAQSLSGPAYPPSPITSNLMNLQGLSLHSPTMKSGSARSFSKSEGSPFQEYCSNSVGAGRDQPNYQQASPDMMSPKIVPLTVLTHSKVFTPSLGPGFLSPPRNSASLLRSPFTAGARGSLPGTPRTEISMLTPSGSASNTPLPRVSLTPRSSSSRGERGPIPRFPSPSRERSNDGDGPPMQPFLSLNLPPSEISHNQASFFVSKDSSPLVDSKAPPYQPELEQQAPPPAGRSLLGTDLPLDSFLIPRTSGRVADTESLSDDDDDDFLLAFPSAIIEEKQQQLSSRHSKQPRTSSNWVNHASATSLGSLVSVSSLRGINFAPSYSNLRDLNSNSMTSLNHGDGAQMSGMTRAESSTSLGLNLDVPLGNDSANRRDLITPVASSSVLSGPPVLPKGFVVNNSPGNSGMGLCPKES